MQKQNVVDCFRYTYIFRINYLLYVKWYAPCDENNKNNKETTSSSKLKLLIKSITVRCKGKTNRLKKK